MDTALRCVKFSPEIDWKCDRKETKIDYANQGRTTEQAMNVVKWVSDRSGKGKQRGRVGGEGRKQCKHFPK